jgi:hypothetical protein
MPANFLCHSQASLYKGSCLLVSAEPQGSLTSTIQILSSHPVPEPEFVQDGRTFSDQGKAGRSSGS